MQSLRKRITIYRSISWALIASLYCVVLLPAHYHLHHLNSVASANHAHVIDLHVIADKQALTHHDEGTSIFAATPYGIVKNDGPVLFLMPVLASLLLILAVGQCRVSYRSVREEPDPYRHDAFFSPPLRAPPSTLIPLQP
jgi:hypothetical protein